MPSLKCTGSSPLPVTVHASCRIQTVDKVTDKRQLVVDIPQNPFEKEALYTVTFSVPPRYKEEDDGEGDEVQDLVHVFMFSGTTFTFCQRSWLLLSARCN